ncbi:MAG: hypothetical protein AB1489_17810 [Acidobacteriota bacterium]
MLKNHNSEKLLMDRRKFLITSGLGAAGLTLYPFQDVKASPVLIAIGEFALAVGAAVVANVISEYIAKNYINKTTAEEVKRTNEMMAQSKFSDLTVSKVYTFTNVEENYFFYPARHENKFNTCVAYFDRNHALNSQKLALIEGPTLFGIAQLSTKLKKRTVSTEIIKKTLLPREQIQTVNGPLEIGYSKPEIYRTDNGQVVTTYKTDGSGVGTVSVRAIREGGSLLQPKSSDVLAEGEYELAYNPNYRR